MKWTVGQEVYMFCGSEVYGLAKGEVVKVTSTGMEVKLEEPIVHYEHIPPDNPKSFRKDIFIIRFDNNGIELEADRRNRHGFEPGPGFDHDRFMQSIWYSAPECGPWTLDDMPFAERTTWINTPWSEVSCPKCGHSFYTKRMGTEKHVRCILCGGDSLN